MNSKEMGLKGKSVVNNEGAVIGTIIDVHTDYETGLADSITVNPKNESLDIKKNLQNKEEEIFYSPNFTRVRDIVVIDEEINEAPRKKNLFK